MTSSFVIKSQPHVKFKEIKTSSWVVEDGLYHQKTIYGDEFENFNWHNFKKSNTFKCLTATKYLNRTLVEAEEIKFTIAQTKQQPNIRYSYKNKKKKEFLEGRNIYWGIEINCISNGINENIKIIFRTDYEFNSYSGYDNTRQKYYCIWNKYEREWRKIGAPYEYREYLSDDPSNKTEILIRPISTGGVVGGYYKGQKIEEKTYWGKDYNIRIAGDYYSEYKIPNVTKINYIKILVGPYAEVYVGDFLTRIRQSDKDY